MAVSYALTLPETESTLLSTAPRSGVPLMVLPKKSFVTA